VIMAASATRPAVSTFANSRPISRNGPIESVAIE
jgi:hypothetical protein